MMARVPSILTILSVVFVWCDCGQTLRDGEIYKFTNKLDNQVLTISPSTDGREAGVSIIMGPWKDELNQKFLAVQAVVAGDNYLLMPLRQKWNWNKFVARGDGVGASLLRDRHDDLPDFTLVLSVHNFKATNKSVTQQYRDSKPNQQWRSVKTDNGAALIQNIATNFCLKNSGLTTTTVVETKKEEKPTGFFQRVKQVFGRQQQQQQGQEPEKKDEKKFDVVQIVSCDRTDVGQQWILQALPMIN